MNELQIEQVRRNFEAYRGRLAVLGLSLNTMTTGEDGQSLCDVSFVPPPVEMRKRVLDSIQFNLRTEDAKQILRIPIAEGDFSEEKGRDMEPHITVLFGLMDADPKKLSLLTKGMGSIEVELGDLEAFPANPAGYQPLVIRVEGKKLEDLHYFLAASFPTFQTHASYKPHICVAYLKANGSADKYVDAGNPLRGRKIVLDDLVLSKADKSIWPLERSLRYSPDQPRDENGQWSGGGGSGLSSSEKKTWVTGGCFAFAKALKDRIPGSEYVGLYSKPEESFLHVGVKQGDKYFDVNGKQTKEDFAKPFWNQQYEFKTPSEEDIQSGLSYAWKDNPDWPNSSNPREPITIQATLADAHQAVDKVFPSLKSDVSLYHGTPEKSAASILKEGLKTGHQGTVWAASSKAEAAGYALGNVWATQQKEGLTDAQARDSIIGLVTISSASKAGLVIDSATKDLGWFKSSTPVPAENIDRVELYRVRDLIGDSGFKVTQAAIEKATPIKVLTRSSPESEVVYSAVVFSGKDNRGLRNMEEDEHWITLNGAHVLIGKGGTIEKGPKGFIGKKPSQLKSDLPLKKEGMVFVSPNETERVLSFEQAKENLNSEQQKQQRLAAMDVVMKVDHGGNARDAVGDWKDGSENSLVVTAHTSDPEQVRYMAALLGNHANQKAVIPFVPGKGRDSVWTFQSKKDMSEVRNDLQKAGIEFRTLQPSKGGGTRVWVFDVSSSLKNKMEEIGKSYNTDVFQIRGRGEFLEGQTRDEAHKVYGEVIANYERYHEPYSGHYRSIPGEVNDLHWRGQAEEKVRSIMAEI